MMQSFTSMLGAVEQLAYVPRDYNSALRYWTQVMGVGPFFRLEHQPLANTLHRGKTTFIDASNTLGYWGDMQIELIKQHNDGASTYKEWLDDGREGLHHVLCRTSDLEKARQSCLDAGGVVVTEGELPGAGFFLYVDMGRDGPMVEVAWIHPSFDKLFKYMRDAARSWDGRDPVRPLPLEEVWRCA